MTVHEYMQILSTVDPGTKACVGVVWIGKQKGSKHVDIQVATQDSFSAIANKADMAIIAETVLNLITTRSGLRDQNMNGFLSALQVCYSKRMKKEQDLFIQQCKKLINTQPE